MADTRIKDLTFQQASFDPLHKLMVDYDGFAEAKSLELRLLGNTYIQGSSNGVTWSDVISASHIYFRISTNGGANWRLLDADFIPETASRQYYSEAKVSANTDVSANTLARHTHTNKSVLDNLINTGTGDNFLADDGTYKSFAAIFMDKTIYDTDDNGIVDNSEALNGQLGSYYLDRANHTGTQVANTISNFQSTVSLNTDVLAAIAHITSDGSSHTFINQDVTNTATPFFDGVKLNTVVSVPAYQEGLGFYDPIKKAWSYYNDEADVMVNTGQEVLFRIYNSSGATITNGSVVYPNGATIGLADAYDKDKCRLVAVATHDIENESYGYITKIGQVGGLNTSMFSLGDVVYLGTNGEFSTTRPMDGGYEVIVGVVDVVDALEGIITVDTNVAQLTVEVTDTNGFPPAEKLATTISFNAGTRTFTIAPTGVDYHYYQLGEKYEKNSSDSIIIENTTGLHYIFFSGDTLVEYVNPTSSEIRDSVLNEVYVAVLYWDASAGVSPYFGEERHGISMSPTTHAYLHITRGTQYIGGLNPTNILVDQTGDLASHAQFGISSGNIADEDLFYDIDPVVSTTGYPIYYRSGASSIWKRVFQAGFPIYNTGSVSGRPYYNQFTGGAWQLTELTNNYYFNCHIFATNDVNYPIAIFMGTNQYLGTPAATDGASTELATIISEGLPFAEFVPIATVTFQTQDNDANTINAHVVTNSLGGSFIDWRESGISGVVGASTSATSYLDLTDTDNTYSGKQSYIPQVNVTEDALVLRALNTFNLSSFNDDLNINEKAQDAIGTILSNEFNYNDATPSISLNFANISHTSLQDVGVNAHSVIDTHIADSTIHFTQSNISITASQVSNFSTSVSANSDVSNNTAARHAAVTVADSSTIDFTLTGQQITASVIQSAISHLSIANVGTNTHNQIDTHIADTTIHYLQSAITNVSTALSTGLLKVTTGTGLLSTAVADTDYLTPSTASSTYAPLASPALTGIPTAPTATTGTNTTQIATTAFVQTELAGASGGASILDLVGYQEGGWSASIASTFIADWGIFESTQETDNGSGAGTDDYGKFFKQSTTATSQNKAYLLTPLIVYPNTSPLFSVKIASFDGTGDYSLKAGLSSTTDIWSVSDNNIVLYANNTGNYYFGVSNGSSSSVYDTGISSASTVPVMFVCEIESTTSVKAYLYDTDHTLLASTTFTSNIPTSILSFVSVLNTEENVVHSIKQYFARMRYK